MDIRIDLFVFQVLVCFFGFCISFVFFFCFGSVNGHCQSRPGVGFDAEGCPRLFLRSLRAENVDESLADVCVLGSHGAAEIHFDVLAVAEPDFAACHLDEPPDPNARLEGAGPDRHAI